MIMVSARKDAVRSILSLHLKQPPPSDNEDEVAAELLRRVRREDVKAAETLKPLARLPNREKS
jgi:hypothetical protein